MLTKSTCQNCGGHLEFDVDDTGKEIECPHCQQQTLLRAAFRQSPPKGSIARPRKTGIIIIVVICQLIILGTIGGAYYFLRPSPGDVAADAVGGLGFLIACVLGVLAFILAVFWLIFPWMVYSMLKRMNDTLEKIEANTRKP
jgi:hypothetical protein